MTAYYDILKKIKELLDADISVTSVTEGMTHDIANRKFNLYTNAHIDASDFMLPKGNIIRWNIVITVMDLEDISKDSVTDVFKGNNNRQDILNTTAAVHVRLAEQLRRGDITEDGFQLFNDPNPEKFINRFEDGVTGWFAVYQINTIKNMTIC